MTQKALLVGINTYPSSPLAGCIHDIQDMATFLVEKAGFKEAEIRLLADSRATTPAIRARLNWLLKDLAPGDRILFHYSGHGAQVATRDIKGEVDGLDECICPVDFDWTDPHMIRDKEFHALFARIPAGVHFVWISDSCHSGDLSRDLQRVRAMPSPPDIAWRTRVAQGQGRKARKPAEGLPGSLISGCQDHQTSADATFNGRPNGALTYFLLRELRRQGGTTRSLDQVVKATRTALKKEGFNQSPGLEGVVQALVP